MTVYSPLNGVTLLTGAADAEGHPITVRKINGSDVDWNSNEGIELVALSVGTAQVTQMGIVSYDDGDDISGHPGSGVAGQANGSFTFTLEDSQRAESPIYVATVTLNGQQSGPALTGGVNDAGFDAARDAGTTFDYYVDDVNGSDANSGLSAGAAKETIQAAVNQAVSDGISGGESIGVRAVSSGGVYRETVDLSQYKGLSGLNNEVRISGYGTEKPRITGGEVITGWSQCSSARQALLGSGFASVYEYTFNIAATLDFRNNTNVVDLTDQNGLKAIWGINPFERLADGSWVPLSMGILRDATVTTNRFQSRIDYMMAAEEFLTTGDVPVSANGQPIVKIRDDGSVNGRNIAALNATALAQAFVQVKHSPTVITNTAITAINGNTISLQANPAASYSAAKPGLGKLYSIRNYAADLAVGSWAVIDNGDGTATLFVRPHEVGSIAAQRIEMSVRSKSIWYRSQSNAVSNCIIENMEVVQAGGVNALFSFNIGGYSSGGSIRPDNIKMRNLLTGRMDGSTSTERGINIDFTRIDNSVVENVELIDCDGCYGIVRSQIDGCRFSYIKGKNLGNTPMRGLVITNHVDYFCDFINCGQGQHSNQGEYKQGSFNCWMHGVRTRGPLGYYNFQAATDLWYTFCDIGANIAPDGYAGETGLADSRTFEDQGGTAPYTGGKVALWNTLLSPPTYAGASTSSIRLSSGGHDVVFDLYNCILSGGVQDAAKINGRGNNIAWAKPFFIAGTADYHSSTSQSSLVAVFADHGSGDLSPANGSPWLTKTGTALTQVKSELTIIFGATLVNDLLGKDMFGQSLTSGLVGPLDNPNDWV